MLTKFKLGGAALALVAVMGATQARAASDQQDLVDRARMTIEHLKTDKEFGNSPDLLKTAKAVMVVPSLVKGGFFVGGEGGQAVLLTKNSAGTWSYPAFYTLASASFGLQIGMETAELVLFLQSDKAVKAFMENQVTLGGQAGLAVVTLGSTASAGTTTNASADIIAWSSATGAYAGLTLNGTVIKPRDSYNQAYYGKPETPSQIVMGHAVKKPAADPLRNVLSLR
ncbi:MAG TPA: lipid-binding SYLF domain-containing protein [Stellaceae bacterium]|nr:lipid-binding SYLF domain-containing protein [Stellaceae bacterium]